MRLAPRWLALVALSCAPPQAPSAEPGLPPPPVTAAASASALPPSSAAPAASSAPAAPAASAAPAPAAAASSAAAPRGPCPADMVRAGKACIDRFEAPNIEGEKPTVMATAREAEAWCAGRGKRLCTEDEWVRGCGGPGGQRFPYGTSYKEGLCNDDGVWRNPSWSRLGKWPSDEAKAEVARLDQRDPSGKRAACVAPEGARDMTGNVAEWVRRSRQHDVNHEHVAMGCFWGKCFRPPHTPTCDYANDRHPGGWRSYEIGFRCCKTAEGGSR